MKNTARPYFEGWYLKHQAKDHVVCFIPGTHTEPSGRQSAFVQVITGRASYHIRYPYAQFCTDNKRFSIRIGGNCFSEDGICVDIKTPELTMRGKIDYGGFTPIGYDAMGPFRYMPFMECRHGVLSMRHSLSGRLLINDKWVDFDNGTGYIEKDSGRSFPGSYFWLQCNHFDGQDAAIVVSAATIPLGGFGFNGCLCFVLANGRQYRLATYNGAKITDAGESFIAITKGNYRLEAAAVSPGNGFALAAPIRGEMVRSINETPSCQVEFTLYEKGRRLFEGIGRHASLEAAGKLI